METLCEGTNNQEVCPICMTCYRYTTSFRMRDRYGLPYDFVSKTCDLFVTNIPSDDIVQSTAYYMWLREGRQEGKADEYWQRAYHDLAKGMNRFLD